MAEKRKRGQYGARSSPYDNLVEKFIGRAGRTGVSIGKAMGACYNTGVNRMKNPEDLTLGELRRLCKTYDISHDEFCSLVRIGV